MALLPSFARVPALAIFLITVAVPSSGLDPSWAVTQYRLQTWTSLQGLPNNSINELIQDREGYLVVHTFTGPVRFDGVRFREVPYFRGDREAHLRLVTRDGTQWVERRGLMQRSSDPPEGPVFSVGAGSVYAAFEELDGTILLGADAGLVRISPDDVESRDTGTGRVRAVLRDRHGVLWIGGDRGLQFEDPSTGTWRSVEELSRHRVAQIAEASDGRLWLGLESGVAVLDRGEVTVLSAANGLPAGPSRGVLEDRDHNLWVATEGNGLVRFRAGSLTLVGESVPLATPALRSLLEDGEGNLWVGTAGGGLVRISDSPFESLSRSEGLPTDFVLAVDTDREGALWAATNGGGVTRFGPEGTRTWAKAEGLPSLRVTAVEALRDGTVLVGTRDGVCVIARAPDKERCRRPPGSDVLDGLEIRTFFEDGDDVWIGDEEGLTRWRAGRFERLSGPAGLAPVRSISRARNGGIWVSGKTIARFAEDRWWPLDLQLPGYPIRSIFDDERGVLWIAVAPGLIRIERGEVSRIPVPAAVDEIVHEIHLDTAERFWLPTNAGLVRVPRAELDAHARDPSKPISWTVFREVDGLRSSELNGSHGSTIAVAPDGRLWFATVAGVVGVDPDVEPRRVTVAAHVEGLVTTDGGLAGSGARLPPGSRRVELHYTALDLSVPESLRFRHRLEPLESSWTDAGSARSALYQSLGPGRYRFRVAASGPGGAFREAVEPFEFEIVSAWWERKTVRWLAILGLVGALVSVPWVRGGQLRRRQVELELAVADKTRELRVAHEQAELTARTDSLTGLANRRGLLERAGGEIRRCRRKGRPISLLLADVDRFKDINDTYGHDIGDLVLSRLAAVLASTLRAYDAIARWGGEEFLVLLPEANADDAFKVAEKVRAAVAASSPLAVEGGLVPVSLTLGVSELAAEETLDAALRRADAALYRGKQAGRDRVMEG